MAVWALGPAADDEDILLAAFYDKELLAPLARETHSYSYHTSPLLELVQYLRHRPEVGELRMRVAGAELAVAR